MINIRVTRLNHVMRVFVLSIICMICFSGCSEYVNSATNAYLVPKDPSPQFGNQSEPIPTDKTLYTMANILAKQGKDSECKAVMKRIMREYPNFFPVYNSLAELQMRQGRTNEAIETIHSGLYIRPQDTILLNNLGMCWLVRMEYENALGMFAEAAGIMPENVRYRANMAVALSLMGRYEESLSLFKQVLREYQVSHNASVLHEATKNANSISIAK